MRRRRRPVSNKTLARIAIPLAIVFVVTRAIESAHGSHRPIQAAIRALANDETTIDDQLDTVSCTGDDCTVSFSSSAGHFATAGESEQNYVVDLDAGMFDDAFRQTAATSLRINWRYGNGAVLDIECERGAFSTWVTPDGLSSTHSLSAIGSRCEVIERDRRFLAHVNPL